MWKLPEGLQQFQTHSCFPGMKEIPRKQEVGKTWGEQKPGKKSGTGKVKEREEYL